MSDNTEPDHVRLVVTIINFRTADLTWACVQSALADLGARDDVRIVVIDNLSGDGSADLLEARIAGLPAGAPVRLIRSDSNSGFSGGHNQGIRVVRGDYYLPLNSDAEIRPGFFDAMLTGAEAAPAEFGLFAPRIVNAAGEVENSLFRFPGAFSEVIRGAGFGPVTRALASHDVVIPPPVAPAQVEWASFAAIMIAAPVIDRIGLLDEGYFMYFEDIDFCLRAHRAGFRIAPVPDAVVMHDEGGSGDVVAHSRARKRLPAYFYASRTRYFTAAHGRAGPFAANMGWYAGRLLSWLRLLRGGRRLRAKRAEWRDIWLNFTDPKGDRHAPD